MLKQTKRKIEKVGDVETTQEVIMEWSNFKSYYNHLMLELELSDFGAEMLLNDNDDNGSQIH